jgi:hypothetical protein
MDVSPSVVQDHIQERAVDTQIAVVVDEAKPAEFVHEKADARPGSADHLGQGSWLTLVAYDLSVCML